MLAAFGAGAVGAQTVTAPQGYPQTFTSPIEGRIEFAGSFAEMRPNHFHGGVDVKTERRVGVPILAIGPGHVSRIGVSPSGFGHVLYVEHPNGYTSVYGHMSAFVDTLAEAARDEQYRRQSFRITATPDSGAFPIRQGQVIGYSGNTGSSTAPHLHLEIRDTETGEPVNPELFGIRAFSDTAPPRIYALRLYARGDESHLVVTRANGQRAVATPGDPVEVRAVRRGGTYVLEGVRRIEASGFVAFALRAHDFHEGSSNILGLFRTSLEVNGERLYSSEMERFSYGETRYLNAHVDYGVWKNTRQWFERSYRLPGNELRLYEARGDGWLRAMPDSSYALAYRIEDVSGNTSRLTFEVDGVRFDPAWAQPVDSLAIPVEWQAGVTIERDGFRAEIPERALYDDIALRYAREPRPVLRQAPVFSDVHRVHTPTEPLHRAMRVAIRPDSVGLAMLPKLMMAGLSDEGKPYSAGGQYDRRTGFVETRTRGFGRFFVTADTTAPTITPRGFADGASLAGQRGLTFVLGDDLSGVREYRGTIDGLFALFEYDPKTALLTYRFDERVGPGPHVVRLEAVDARGNRATYRARFTR